MYSKFAEQAWNDKGKKIEGKYVLGKKSARNFAKEVLANWKGLTPEENESYLAQNFDTIWAQYDNSPKKESGMLTFEQAAKFMADLA